MYYKELKLPAEPIIGFDELMSHRRENLWTYCNTDIDRHVNKDLLDIFDNIGLRPRLFAWFGFIHKQSGKSTIHSDIGYINNAWEPLPFGINWELTPGDMTFYWWDPLDTDVILPDENTPKRDIHGIKFGKDRAPHDSTGYVCLDSFKPKLGIPFLARTDVPHQVVYQTNVDTRIGISLRFDNKDLPTWESAVNKFQPFFL